MPRDGSGIYHRPPGTDAVTDTSIESTKYNINVADVEQDLNAPRPIVAGGTGANNAHDAMIALSGEIAKQHVTNYDSHPWVNGSFYSDGGTTGEPVAGHGFVGTYYGYLGDAFAVLAATDVNSATGNTYVRMKASGVWGAWMLRAGSAADLDAKYVDVAGDNMTGTLGATNIQCSGNIGVGSTGAVAAYYFSTGGLHSLAFDPASANFSLNGGNYFISQPYVMSAQSSTSGSYHFGTSGTVYHQFDGVNHNIKGGSYFISSPMIMSVQGTDTGTYYFGNSTAAYLNHTPGNYTFGGTSSVNSAQFYASGNILAGGALYAGYSAGTGALYLGPQSLTYDGTAFAFSAPVSMLAGFTATSSHFVMGGAGGAGAFYNTSAGADRFWCGTDGAADVFRIFAAPVGDVLQINAPTGLANFLHGVNSVAYITNNGVPCGYGCKEGTGSFNGADYFNFYWNGNFHAYVNTTYLGQVAFTSDYRVKKDVADLPDMWETVKALRPIKYTQAEFSPPSHIKHIASETLKARKEAEDNPEAKPREVATGPMFEADDIERWGFVAHELQETLTPSAATAVKDSPDSIQSPNPFTVIAALTKALQEAMARIEALEGAAQPAR